MPALDRALTLLAALRLANATGCVLDNPGLNP
jgi:hypothetical protein